MSITTKKGDTGMTHSCDMLRIRKTDPRMFAVCELDMLHADIGLCISYEQDDANPNCCRTGGPFRESVHGFLNNICNVLISKIMGEVSAVDFYGYEKVQESDLVTLDAWAAYLNKQFRLKGWVIYGNNGELAARYDKAAKQCRRAELYVWNLIETPKKDREGDQVYILNNELIGAYLNRLSDVLFCLARIS